MRWDFYVFSPNGQKFRSNVEIKKFLEKNPSVKCDLEVTNTSRVKDMEKISPPMKKQKSETANNKVEDTRTFETNFSKSYQQKDFFCELCHLQFDKKAVFDIHNSFVHKSRNDIKSAPKVNENDYHND